MHPSRALGQNFVADPNTVRRIARLAGVGPGDRVLEVGPGLGSLTLALVETGACLTAIEADRRLITVLEGVTQGTHVRLVRRRRHESRLVRPSREPSPAGSWWPTCPTTSPPR